MGTVRSFRDLEIWQLAMDLVEETYRLSSDFPPDERFGLTGQLRRASVSIPANIAEGWGRGRSKAQAAFIRIALGSLCEVETLILLGLRLKTLTSDTQQLFQLMEMLGKKLNAYLTVLQDSVQEDRVPYGDPLN